MSRKKATPATPAKPRNYLLIGAGGTGSILFPLLIRYLETYERTEGKPFTMAVIDGKNVAATKLERQLFFSQFIETNKAQAIIEQYACDPNVIIAVPKYLGEADMGSIEDNDVILIAADNWPIRAHIERRVLSLDNAIVINGGNELIDGSCQIWIRRDGKNITPPLSQGHPEILQPGEDMALMSCQQIAEMPGGGQTIIANSMSATAMLNALRHIHDWEAKSEEAPTWNEAFFDLQTFNMRPRSR